jgi:hypothetical protein
MAYREGEKQPKLPANYGTTSPEPRRLEGSPDQILLHQTHHSFALFLNPKNLLWGPSSLGSRESACFQARFLMVAYKHPSPLRGPLAPLLVGPLGPSGEQLVGERPNEEGIPERTIADFADVSEGGAKVPETHTVGTRNPQDVCCLGPAPPGQAHNTPLVERREGRPSLQDSLLQETTNCYRGQATGERGAPARRVSRRGVARPLLEMMEVPHMFTGPCGDIYGAF